MAVGGPEDAAFDDVLCRSVQAALDCGRALVSRDGTAVARHLWPGPGAVLIIEDARRSSHPARSAFPGAGFVGAVAIHRGPDDVVGALWATDPQPRPATPDLRRRLADFGELASLHAQRAAEATLYRLVAENSADTLIRGNLDGVRQYVSPSISELLGFDAHELVGSRARDITHPDDVEAFGRQMLAMRDGHIDSFITEHRMSHKDGSWVWLEAFVRVTHDPVTGVRDGYVVSVRDTSRRKELETRLAHNASHDTLTGLPNRALLYERLQEQIDRCARHDGEFAVLCVDLDGFKKVNDELGHSVGDTVLTAVGERLVSCVADTDTVARRGGDEFVVVHQSGAPLLESAVALAQQLIDTASAPLTIGEWTGSIGLSIGIVTGGSTSSGEELLRAADRAMYEAKAAGRNGYRIA